MRRTTITALACLSAAAFPAAALADHGGDGNGHGDEHHNPVQQQGSFVDVGAVTAFSGGKLTIAFTDGNTVTASVDRQTEVQCEGMDDFRGHDRGDDHGGNRNDGESCDPLLAAGTGVTGADLEETQSGAFWDEVDLDPGLQNQSAHHHG